MKQLLLLGSLLILTGCVTVVGPGPSAGGRMQSGREITATSDHWYRTICCRPLSVDTEAVRIGRRKVVVAPSQISVDGVVVATVSETTKEVTVCEKDDQLLVVADGETVFATEF